jgi:hypothetical protein
VGTRIAGWIGGWALLVGACNGGADDGDGGASEATTGATGEPTTSGSDGETMTPTTGDGPDGGCDPKAQDCPDGSKCVAYGKMPGDAWNANKCVPDVPGGGIAGDACTVDVDGMDEFSGIDDCSKGYMCLGVDEEGKNGICVAFCSSTDTCEGDAACIPANDGTLPGCFPPCDPLAQDCGGGLGCYGDPSGPPFVCFYADPSSDGLEGSTCEYTNACLPGLYCAPADAVDDCPADSAGCCTPFCALDEGGGCSGPAQCVAFFPEPQAGYENVGVCALP